MTAVCDIYLRSKKFRTPTIISDFDPEIDSFLFENIEHIIIAEHEELVSHYLIFLICIREKIFRFRKTITLTFHQ